MEPDEIDRAITSAEHYVDSQMAPADLVSIVSLGSSLLVNQDFTSDHQLLKKQLDAFGEGSGQGFEEGTTGTTEGTPDTGQPFTADDTEYNIFNTDRRLEAIRSVAEKLSHLQQKKSLIYFSSGMDRTGIENQSELRAAINAAVRSNMAIYTMDIRGLQALVAGGEAQNASLRGTSAYSGQSTINALNSNFTTQETLVTLASDTGGRAFLDSNDFSQVFKGVQQDTSTYYLLGYHSTNPARDGRYRRISVKVNRARSEDRLSQRLLRAGGLPALDQGRQRASTRGAACFRITGHRSAALFERRIFSHWRPTNFSFRFRWSCRARKFPLPAPAIETRPRSM